jgi:hypothetical protein
MLRTLSVYLVAAMLFASSSVFAAAPAEGPATQGELAKKLVEMFGWSEGLPESPADKDYLTILGGRRNLRFEAEEVYDRAYDAVSVRTFNMFGAFTGKGWVHGTTVPTAVHFTVFIPIAGSYTLKASIKGDGQLWSAAGRAFKVNGGAKMQEMTIGKMFVPAGFLEFNAVIPPDGAIDCLTFSAPTLAAVEPVKGWTFPARLTGGDLAEVAAALLGSEGNLPEDPARGRRTVAASSASPLPDSLFLTDSQLLGKTLEARWARAGLGRGQLTLPVEIDLPGVYQLRAHFVGSSLTAGFNGRTVTVPGKPSFDWVDCGVFRLPKGTASLLLDIPPTAGVDRIELVPRKSSPADYVALANLGKGADEPVTSADLDRILTSLRERFKERR